MYTCEFLLKAIAFGFISEEYSYMRDPWNVMDFLIVGASWITMFFEQSNISAFRAIRALRTLRTLSAFPEMAKLVQLILSIIPQMTNIMMLCFIAVIVFAMISMQLFGGCLSHRCINVLD